MNISIIGTYIDTSRITNTIIKSDSKLLNNNKRNLYCYTSCVPAANFHACLASNESNAGLENCTYFLSGNFNDRNELSRKLNQLISKITTEVQQQSNIIESIVETNFEKSILQTTYSTKEN